MADACESKILWEVGSLRCVLIPPSPLSPFSVQLVNDGRPFAMEACANEDEATVIAERFRQMLVAG